VVWKRVVTRRPEGGEKERGRENWSEIHVFWLDLSLYSGHRSGRVWVSAGSVKTTHIHWRRFDRSGRKQSQDPIPTDRPDFVDVRLQSPAGERKKNDREL
jgi:hypothetical protein